MTGRLANKVALVTGSGSGIGLAIAELFLSEGARVAAVARQDKSVRRWSQVENVLAIRADLTRVADIKRIVRASLKEFGSLDIVCNVAGINDLGYPLDETSDDRWDRVLNLDLKAPFQICREVVPGMVERGGGAILNIGSYAAHRGNHGPSYTAAKAGLVGLSLSIAVGYGSHGIRCNVINPGAVRTDIGLHSGGEYHAEGLRRFLEVADRLPINWVCDPREIAHAALFLCSEEASHINGAILAVDGGMSAW